MGRRHSTTTVRGSTRTSVEVMLAEDVESLGKQGEILRVKPGYARNYLLPQGLATIATEHNSRMVERHREKLVSLEKQRIQSYKKLADSVNKYSVTLEANANKDGHLYGSIVAKDISSGLQAAGYPVEPGHIRLEGPLRELGMYTVRVHFHENVETELKVWVVPTATA